MEDNAGKIREQVEGGMDSIGRVIQAGELEQLAGEVTLLDELAPPKQDT